MITGIIHEYLLQNTETGMYLWRVKKHFSLIHSDLVGAGLWSAKENDMFIWECLQRLGLSSLVDRHVLSAHAQPEIMREASFFAL